MASTKRSFTGRSSELSDPLGLTSARTRWWTIQQNASLTTLNQIGFSTAPTQNGTTGIVNATQAQFITYTTAAVLNSDGGWISTAFTQTRWDYRPVYSAAIRTQPSILAARFWMGLFDSSPMASSDPAIHGMGFRYDTGVDGTAFWRCWSNDGAGAGTVTVTTVPFTPSTIYRLAIAVNPNGLSVDFYINDVVVATHSTDLPGGSIDLGHVEQVRTLEAVAKAVSISKIEVEQVAG